jgi:hypothetical protein
VSIAFVLEGADEPDLGGHLGSEASKQIAGSPS